MTKDTLDSMYPDRATIPRCPQDIPRDKFVVYILTFNDAPIVLGHGKHNRAKVVFDDTASITTGHIKALFVRVHRLFGKGTFGQFVIECDTKDEAKQIEAVLHGAIGGNASVLSLK